jgi:hypothetical protein
MEKPAKGPYPTGVSNGPEPTTARGRRRRARKNEKKGQMEGYQASKFSETKGKSK